MKQQILVDVLNPTPPCALYHYTTQAGLIGIIRSKEIWATHTQYLNDRYEYRHAAQIAQDELRSMHQEADNDDTKQQLEEMADSIRGIESMNVCVCSFSSVRDSLPQWRAYGESSAGFAVGIPGGLLKHVAEKHDFYLVQCIYEKDAQTDLIRSLLAEVLDENLERASESKIDIRPRGGNLGAYLHRYAPILKDASFSEEHEWRLISRPLLCSREGFEFRPGRSMLIPYFRLPLYTDETPFDVEEVIVGPTPNAEQSESSVRSLLASKDLHIRNGEVRENYVKSSAVPYRAW